jgi:RNA polymerase subunit RPABC4/transcription elongation factor Spt4
MFCKHCGAQIEEGAKFCPNCGQAISASAAVKPEPVIENPAELRCVFCGNLLKEGAQFCENCGAAVTAVPAPLQQVQVVPIQAAQQQGALSYRQAALQPQSKSGMTALLVLSIIAPIVYVVYVVFILADGYGRHPTFMKTIFLYGCPLAQSILAFVKSVKLKKSMIVGMSIIAILFYLGYTIDINIHDLMIDWGIYTTLVMGMIIAYRRI